MSSGSLTKVHRFFTRNFLRNYDHLVDLGGNSLICVDPTDGNLILKKSEEIGKPIEAIFITHEHGDHYSGLGALSKKFDLKVYCPKTTKPLMEKKLKARDKVFEVSHGEEVLGFKVHEVPGHMPTHIGFITDENCFLGDTIFNFGIGNTRYGSSEVLFETIKVLRESLPKNATLWSEHDYWESNLLFTLDIDPQNQMAKQKLAEYNSENFKETGDFPPSLISMELAHNLFLRTNLSQVQKLVAVKLKTDNLSDKETFIKLRSLRDKW